MVSSRADGRFSPTGISGSPLYSSWCSSARSPIRLSWCCGLPRSRAAAMRFRKIRSRADGNDPGRIDGSVAFVIVAFDVLHVHGRRDPGKLEDVPRERPQVGVIDEPPRVALEVSVVDLVEAHQGREQPDVSLEAVDASPAVAVLREAEEEIALDRRFVEPIGYLDVHMTPSGYRILPTLARVREGFSLRVQDGEVDDAFEVPLAFLMAPQNHKRKRAEWNGLITTVYAIPFNDREIWGVTAGILRNFLEKIYKR